MEVIKKNLQKKIFELPFDFALFNVLEKVLTVSGSFFLLIFNCFLLLNVKLYYFVKTG